MASVTGETAAGAAAILAKTPASGVFNGSNHLIVTLHDATTIDMGPVDAATTTLAGVVELSTDALAIAVTDTTTAVTPHALGAHAATFPGNKVQSLTTIPLETAVPSSYPTGISIMTTTSWSLNAGNGIVVTVNNGSSDCQQTFYSPVGTGSAPQMWTRTYNSGWTTWGSINMIVLLTASSYIQSTVVGSYPVGDSRLYYTTGSSGSWDFTGKAGEVWTYNDGATFARQTFTRTQGGTPNYQEQWIRTNDYVSGWTPWHKIQFQDSIAILASASSAITTTAQTAVTGLQVAVEASATYLMEAFFIIASTVATADTMANSWTGPSGATMVWGDTNSTSDIQVTLGSVAVGDATLNAATHLSLFKGVLKTSTTAGNLTPTFGVSATTTSPSYTVGTNSYVRLTRIA